MKKSALLVVLLFVFAVVITGCGKDESKKENKKADDKKVETKTLACTITEDDDEYAETIDYKLTYENDKVTVTSLSMKRKYTSGKFDEEDYKEAADECKDALKGKGVTCNTSSSGSLINAYFKFTVADMDEATETVYEEAGFKELASKKYNDLKKYMTDAGFECKEEK